MVGLTEKEINAVTRREEVNETACEARAELAEFMVLQDYEHDPLPQAWGACVWPHF